ncbi:MAG: hypothetical protein F9K22_06170 [Bacteroidetes bacterium]|nr:MAG: hypothetical protein F9K22_06170 [Bacteroidota bacterium]
MKEEELLLEIEQAAQDMNLRIRYEKGDFDGGYCILRDENIIVVNKKLAPIRKCSVIAQALGEYGIDQVYMKPIVRTYVEDEIVRAKAAAGKNVVRRTDAAAEAVPSETPGSDATAAAEGASATPEEAPAPEASANDGTDA